MNPFRCATVVDIYSIHLKLVSGKELCFREFVPKGTNFDISNFFKLMKKQYKKVQKLHVHQELYCKCQGSHSLITANIKGTKIVKDYCNECDTWYNALAVQENHLSINKLGERLSKEFPNETFSSGCFACAEHELLKAKRSKRKD